MGGWCCIYKLSAGAVATYIGAYIEWTMHALLHVTHTHACVTPSGAIDIDAPVHVTSMNNIFIRCANVLDAYVTYFLEKWLF